MAKQKYNDKTINIRLPQNLAKDAWRKAKREKRPLSEVIRELLRAWLSPIAK